MSQRNKLSGNGAGSCSARTHEETRHKRAMTRQARIQRVFEDAKPLFEGGATPKELRAALGYSETGMKEYLDEWISLGLIDLGTGTGWKYFLVK